jgi:uncharacterized caspase-like protein
MAKGMNRRQFAQCAALGLAASWAWPAIAQPRQKSRALILAQSYRDDGKLFLPNTLRDGALMQQVFQKLAFDEVLLLQDQPADQTTAELSRFLAGTSADDLVVTYLAGHGVQIGTENLLMLNGANRFISLQSVMETLQDRSRTVLVFLDACRNNPYDGISGSGQISRSVVSRSLAAQPVALETVSVQELRGAAQDAAGRLKPFDLTGSGIKIVFSTDPYNVALDGATAASRNSPFAQALARRLLERRSLDDVIAVTTGDVLAATQSQQSPWSQGSIGRPLFLAGPPLQRNPSRPRFQVPG